MLSKYINHKLNIFIYKGNLMSTIGEEKRFNPRLTKSESDFVKLMKDLKLDLPKMIGIAF